MNSQLLEYIYETYQPQQYYRKYLTQANQRPDGRSSAQHRSIRISISMQGQPNGNSNGCGNGGSVSVTVSRDNTIVMAQLTTKIQKVVYSPISDTYGRQLIDITVNNQGKNSTKTDRNSARQIQNYIQQFIDWKLIEKQLVHNFVQKGQIYAHVGTIVVRIPGEDGCIEQSALVAIQMLLWNAQFYNIQRYLRQHHKSSANVNATDMQKMKSVYSLNIQQFWYPTKYVQILDKLITDPTGKQQAASNFQLSFVSNIKGKGKEKGKTYRKINVHKNGSLPQQKIRQIQKLYEVELSKLPFNLQEIKQRSNSMGLRGQKAQQVITITGL